MKGDGSGRDPSSARRRRTAGLVVVVAVLGVLAASGLGAEWIEGLVDRGPPLSYTAEETGFGCSSITYVPARSVARIRRHAPPKDLRAFERQAGARFVGGDLVRVTVEAGTARELTITGIEFLVERRRRPGGAAFVTSCNEEIPGRGFEADVEAEPPRLTASSANWEGSFSPVGLGGSSTHPVSFPWTVSLRRPLRLAVVASARRCYCVWSARLPWVSGGDRGVIRLDNGGRGYTVVGLDGLSSFGPAGDKWQQYRVSKRRTGSDRSGEGGIRTHETG